MTSSRGCLAVLINFLALAIAASTAAQPIIPDAVSQLPGWNKSLPSKWYSGHVPAGIKDGKHLWHHYVLIESESDPDKDPVVVWSNGGPGAPSLYGLLVELGPLLLSADSVKTPEAHHTGIPSLFRNPYSWTAKANLLVINGPPPVGFSYCDPPGPNKGDFKKCGKWNDSSTAYHNRLAIEGVLERHPRLLHHDFFFTGESYAGVYIPMLVRELLDHGPSTLRIKGMMLGNACMGTDVLCFSPSDVWWRILFLRGHGQLPEDAFAAFDAQCGAELRLSIVSPQCGQAAKQLESVAQGFYEYDVYSECWYDQDFLLRGVGEPTLDKCGGDSALNAWTSRPEVRKALNVAVDSGFFSGDNGNGFEYAYTERDLRGFYVKLARSKRLRLLVYNGDTDVSVNYLASQNWTSHLGLSRLEQWRAWTLDGNRAMAGFVTHYDGLDFVTIRGSGHMVPRDKSRAALELLNHFLANSALPRYKGKTSPSEPQISFN